MTKNILMILTSNDRMGKSGKATGFWAEEFAAPYYTLIDAGAKIDIATPAGGVAPIDAASLKPKGQNEDTVERFLADSEVRAQLQGTLRARALDASRYDAVFFPGGHGTMWDLPLDAGVTRAVETAFASGKVIASVCHGAAGLITARRPDGLAVVEGRRINSFTDSEEEAAGLTDVVPFALESRLRQLGARFESAANWQPFAIHDGQFVTGQNPQSSKLVARHVVAALRLPI